MNEQIWSVEHLKIIFKIFETYGNNQIDWNWSSLLTFGCLHFPLIAILLSYWHSVFMLSIFCCLSFCLFPQYNFATLFVLCYYSGWAFNSFSANTISICMWQNVSHLSNNNIWLSFHFLERNIRRIKYFLNLKRLIHKYIWKKNSFSDVNVCSTALLNSNKTFPFRFGFPSFIQNQNHETSQTSSLQFLGETF